MQHTIKLREGFSFIYEEEQKKLNVLKLVFLEMTVARNWMEVTDFVAILECALRNKLGTKKKYESSGVVVYGEIDEEFHVCIQYQGFDRKIFRFDIVETQQIVSKLNKLLHMANKLHTADFNEYM